VKGNQTYYLTAKGEWNCTATDSLKVIALKVLKIPNAFTPNGDNIHDKWDIDELKDFPFVEVEVFNRNGHLVYHSTGYSNPWDGTLNGKPLPVGTYYYIIDLKNNFPKQAGSVTILK
jgi:gliding motility-associated-like protein